MSLTDEQLPIVQAPPTAKLLVTAGPGTGKTHVLVARLGELIQNHDLAAGSEILVLTFSRAAVREIRNRISSAEGGARYVRARTFDSFATQLLAEIYPNGTWSELDYDGRIRSATSLISTSSDAKQLLSQYAHVLVDELQDLVGERADFVKAILHAVPGGFTLLGDPAQGIYNFQLEEPVARREGSAVIYNWLRSNFKTALKEHKLSINHRARTDEAKLALWAGPLLNKLSPNYSKIKEDLETVVSGLRLHCDYADPDTVAAAFTRCSAPTAILCYDNGQALMISRRLHEKNISHVLHREAVDRAVPKWVGALLATFDHKQIGKSVFLTRAAEFGYSEKEAISFWKLLKRTDNRSGDSLDLDKLAQKIRIRNLPDDLSEHPQGSLVVSTIHRAKGLEFDRVVVISPRREYEEDLTPEEARVMYVALTRPKCELRYMETPGFKGLFRHTETERWTRRFGWKVADVEFRGDDAHRDDPPGAFLVKDCNARETQAYILSKVVSGDPVVLKRMSSSNQEGAPRIHYVINHKDRCVGVTSENFGGVFFRLLKLNYKWEVRWPETIEGLHVETVDTVAGTEAAAKCSGLGPAAIWVRVRVSGLGCLHF